MKKQQISKVLNTNHKKIIIGINWEQNSSAALMIDGEIISASSEERFSNKKNDESYPKRAIDFLLKSNKIKKEQITNICFISEFWSPTYSLIRHYTNFSIKDYIKEQEEYWFKRIYKNKKLSLIKIFKKKLDTEQFPGKKFWNNKIKKILINDHSSNRSLKNLGQEIRYETVKTHLNISRDKVTFVDHSFGHIAYAYCSGPLNNKNSYVVSIDAFGDFVNYAAFFFKKTKKKIQYKKIVSGSNSVIARMYRYITLILGMKPNEHEYKVMGLAPYCKPKYSQQLLDHFKTFQIVKKNTFKDLIPPKDYYFYFKKLFIGHRFDAIAGALQKYTEYLLIGWVKNLVNPKVTKNLCMAGGVAMNVKANLEISKLKNVSQVYIPPSPDDSSQSMGACYAYCLMNEIETKPLENAYLGYQIDDIKVKKILKKLSSSKYKISNTNIFRKTAQLLLENKIIGICRGNAEFGARSLGNRSIICNPSKLENVKKINETVKNRDFWMPFAATIIDKYAAKYFKIKHSNLNNYKYMTNCVETFAHSREKLTAAIHPYDKTCRPQIITQKNNPFYYKIIREFGKRSGIYSLLNTSLNTHGNPIINNELQAITMLKKTNLDAIIIGNYIVEKK
jgi:carbamoyltransferase